MAILRTRSSRDQAWPDLPWPEPLPFGIRYSPAPLPVRPLTPELDEDLGRAILAACAAEARAERAAVPVDASPVERFVLAALNRMFAPGSLPFMYRRVVSARWTRAPDPEGSRWVRATAAFEMWDRLPAACWVRADPHGVRFPRPTGMLDSFGEEVRLMATSPTTWLSMGWDSMEGGPASGSRRPGLGDGARGKRRPPDAAF